MGRKGNMFGLLSGLTWALYTVLISLVDLFFNVVFEMFVLRKNNLMLPPFFQRISTNVLLGCIIIFCGTSLVIIGDTVKVRKYKEFNEL